MFTIYSLYIHYIFTLMAKSQICPQVLWLGTVPSEDEWNRSHGVFQGDLMGR